MADLSYFPGRVYRNQAGDLVCPSSAAIQVESGGSLEMQAGASFTQTTGATFKTHYTVGSTAGTLLNSGLSNIKSTSGTKLYPLAAPVVGVLKYIHVSAATTSNLAKLDAGSGRTFDGTNRYLVFKRNNAGAVLGGLTTARWGMVAQSGSTVHVTYVNS